MSFINLIEQLHRPSYNDLKQFLENLVNETQAQRVGKASLTSLCEADSHFLEMEDGPVYVYQNEKAYKEVYKGSEDGFITVLALWKFNSV